jgi:hypothetical protein
VLDYAFHEHGDSYPAALLWPSHIKKRTACSDEDARDISDVAMLACLFNCDALFEPDSSP